MSEEDNSNQASSSGDISDEQIAKNLAGLELAIENNTTANSKSSTSTSTSTASSPSFLSFQKRTALELEEDAVVTLQTTKAEMTQLAFRLLNLSKKIELNEEEKVEMEEIQKKKAILKDVIEMLIASQPDVGKKVRFDNTQTIINSQDVTKEDLPSFLEGEDAEAI
eukprot:Awhi_evm1s13364